VVRNESEAISVRPGLSDTRRKKEFIMDGRKEMQSSLRLALPPLLVSERTRSAVCLLPVLASSSDGHGGSRCLLFFLSISDSLVPPDSQAVNCNDKALPTVFLSQSKGLQPSRSLPVLLLFFVS